MALLPVSARMLNGQLLRHPYGLPQGGRIFPTFNPLPSRRHAFAVSAHMDFHSAHHVAISVQEFAHNAAFMLADVSTDAVSVAVDAAASAPDVAADAGAAAAQSSGGWFSGLADILEGFLKVLEKGLDSLHVPYAYGFSIILLTLLVKLATYPLTKQQVESTMAMQNLAPKIKAIQAKYAGDQERIQLETARIYKTAGVNPLAGCLPTLATIPVFIGLYQALTNVAKEGELTEGFFWIPSLAGPTSIAARDSGSGISWLVPFVDGAPPLGWLTTVAYLVLPVLLVGSQYFSMKIMQPPQSDDPAQKQTQAILQFLPLMIGWFSLSVPSGLSLYWFTNNVLSTAQMVYLRKMGGAKPAVGEGAVEIIDVGQAKRSGAGAVAVVERTGGAVAERVQTDVEKERAERFRKLKEAEAAKRAAKRAAEEAARQAGAKGAEERERLLASTPAPSKEEEAEEEEEEEGEEEQGPEVGNGAAVTPSAAATSADDAAKPAAPRKSKRSRRARRT